MALQGLLLHKKSAIVSGWFESLLASYPAETAKYLSGERDQFQNPVGRTIAPALDRIFDALVSDAGQDELQAPLDDIIRIRSVQDFTAAGAVSFVFDLKQVIRTELGERLDNGTRAELAALDLRIDRMALLAFDVFMECREQIYAIRAKELKNRTAALLRRHNYVVPDPEMERKPEDGG
jgi:hypothetical protein